MGGSWFPKTTLRRRLHRERNEKCMTADEFLTSDWRGAIQHLAAFPRPSASPGERRAAEWIAGRLDELGCKAVTEEEQAHGGYWWPIGVANLLAAGGALMARRRGRGRILAAAGAGLCAVALWDDLGQGRRWLRMLLPKRATWNVVAETGDREARRTVVLVAHHDAAHSGLVFHPALARIPPRMTPGLHERSQQSLPILYAVWLGPVLISAGALLSSGRMTGVGIALCAGAITAMTDIALRPVVPGANDNLSAVAVLIALASRFREHPLRGVRVLLVSTGSEESFSEGMQAFARRHFDELAREHTEILCLECLGGPRLVVLEGEGMLWMRQYPLRMREEIARAAAEAGIPIGRGLRTVAATDALIALRAGYQVGTLASVDYTKLPLNYHWPSDTPAALHWKTIEQAIAVCDQFLRGRSSAASLSADTQQP